MLGNAAIRLDILFAVNWVIDFCLFWFAGSISWARPPWWRVALVATLGAALAAMPLLLPVMGWLLLGPAALILAALLVLLLVWPCSGRQFWAAYGGLWAGLGVTGGATAGLAQRTLGLSTVIVACGTTIALVGFSLIWQAGRERRRVKAVLRPIQVSLGGQTAVLTGLVDSGNGLRTPITRRPVAVVEAEYLRSLLPGELLEALSMGWDGLVAVPEAWRSRCQLIPYSAVGQPAAALLSLAPERLAMWGGERKGWVTVGGVIALTLQKLSQSGEYQALLPPEMLEEAERG